MWFQKLTGFNEESPENVREKLRVEGNCFVSTVNNRRMQFGQLEIATLDHLRHVSPSPEVFSDTIRVSEVVGNVQGLHCRTENAHALFQAASQFNLLEMVGPHITPEQGIDRYENDYTQGPACAIACGAGTIFRNYFVKIGSQLGQTSDTQIDCLDLIGQALENEELILWSMKNGYALLNQAGLLTINKKLATFTDQQREGLKSKLKVGIQWDTEVTLSSERQTVSQVYCSALPVAYSQIASIYWEPFARLVLEATYEASLYTALINMEKYQSNVVYLTLVGGGAFGNEEYWILESLQKAIGQFQHTPLDVRVVSYGRTNPNLKKYLPL